MVFWCFSLLVKLVDSAICSVNVRALFFRALTGSLLVCLFLCREVSFGFPVRLFIVCLRLVFRLFS